jgi:hypothetical protein
MEALATRGARRAACGVRLAESGLRATRASATLQVMDARHHHSLVQASLGRLCLAPRPAR